MAPLVIAANQRRYRELELDETTFLKSNRLMRRILDTRNRPVPRSEICGLLEKEGVSAEGQRAYHLLQRAGLEGLICLGPNRGREATYKLLSPKTDPSPNMELVQAQAALIERYFTGVELR